MRSTLFIISALITTITAARAADWTQWGGQAARNMVSAEKRLPDWFDPDSQGTAPAGSVAGVVRWKAELGIHSYGTPVISGGRVFVGTSSNLPYDSRRDIKGGGGIVCFDEKTGKLVWQLVTPKFTTKLPKFNFDHLSTGVCSTGTVEGNRLYVVSDRDELLCLDTAGLANGNDGPFKDEAAMMTPAGGTVVPLAGTDADIIWKLDMIDDPDVNAWPQDAADCSPLILGDYVYVSPSNGVDESHKNIPRPNAPSIIAVDKKTGRVVVRDRAGVGPKIFHGEWSSPSAGKVNGRMLLFWGGGDGVCYAFDPRPTPPTGGDRLGTLETVWRFDVNAAAGRHGNYRTKEGPSEVISTPVLYKNRIYVTIGQDPTHGRGHGALACIDATKKGDITQSGLVWLFGDIDRSISTVTIADGLAYAADEFGMVFCLDADTGKLHWKYDTKKPICSSPMVADGKVYIGTDGGDLWVFAAGTQLKVINTIHVGSAIAATPVAANGTLYVQTQNWLYAVEAAKRSR